MNDESTCIPGISGCRVRGTTPGLPITHVWPCHQSTAWIKQKKEERKGLRITKRPLLERADAYLDGEHKDPEKDEEFNMLVDITIAHGLVMDLAKRVRELEAARDIMQTHADRPIKESHPDTMIAGGPARRKAASDG